MPARLRRPQRRAELSQHFLRSGALAASLVERSSVAPSDLVVEIGPGRGALTRALARCARRVVAVELDPALAAALRAEFAGEPGVDVVEGDFLAYPLPGGAYKVFGSIPFSRTAGIVRRVVDAPTPPLDAYLVVQREAAERFAGAPYAPETLASLLLKPWWHVEIAHRLRRTDFDPPPSVECVLLWLARRARPLVERRERAAYRGFVARAFGRRGGSVGAGLRGLLTRAQVARLAHDLRFEAGAPPSALSFDQWLGLYRYHAYEAYSAAPR